MALSAASVIQSDQSSATASTASVALPSGTTEGSTVIVEITAGGLPISDVGTIPPGFDFDAMSINAGSRYLWVYRKSSVAAGEGVAGSTTWDFTISPPALWIWRVTEWNTDLDPVSPLETFVYNAASGTGVTTLSTGTTNPTLRANTVALAWHHWQETGTNSAQTFDWDSHTNGFTERGELRFTSGTTESDSCWSWAFGGTLGQTFECTATVNTTPRRANDNYTALMVVYGEPQVEIVPAPTVLTGGGVPV